MVKKNITLEFKKSVSDLTGNRLGRSVFEKQIQSNIIDEFTQVSVEIPENINDVGTSFIQGIYSKLSEEYGSEKALKILSLYSKNTDTNVKIKKAIQVYGI